jgi:DNA polymerase-1
VEVQANLELCAPPSILVLTLFCTSQGGNISCKEGRIHCSININTETGRLSARIPNLQVCIFRIYVISQKKE